MGFQNLGWKATMLCTPDSSWWR